MAAGSIAAEVDFLRKSGSGTELSAKSVPAETSPQQAGRACFGRAKPSQQVDKLIHRIADHHRSADYSELYKLLPGVKLYFPVSPSVIQGLPRGQPIKVPKDSDFRLQKTVVKGRTLAVLYTSSSDRRLGPHYVEIEGAEALRMALRIADIDGLLTQSATTAWIGIEKEQIANVLDSAA